MKRLSQLFSRLNFGFKTMTTHFYFDLHVYCNTALTLLHSEWLNFHRVLTVLSAIGLNYCSNPRHWYILVVI